MRLHSATVRHYRVHEDTSVTFHPERTLIGGANESGKSTFMEAVHRGLFVKSTISGQVRDRMLSKVSGESPHVTVVFEIGEKIYTVDKYYSGSSGTTRLLLPGNQALHGLEAETRLLELLNSELDPSRRINAGNAGEGWAHLMVWQGESLGNPGEMVGAKIDLLSRLERDGAAAMLSSEVDSAVVTSVEQQKEAFYTETGRTKANGPLDAAEQELARAEEAVKEVQGAVQTLEQNVTDYEEAERTIRSTREAIDTLKDERVQLVSIIREADDLANEYNDAKRSMKDAEKAYGEFDKVLEKIGALQEQMSRDTAQLEPDRESLENLLGSQDQAKKSRKEAEERLGGLRTQERELARRERQAKRWMDRMEIQRKLERGSARLRRLEDIGEQVTTLTRSLADLAPVEESHVKRLDELERERDRLRSQVEGMTTRVELLSSSVKVSVDGDGLEEGGSVEVSEVREVKIGDVASLRIVPGGGGDLEAVGRRLKEVEESLAEQLEKLGVADVDHARRVEAERAEARRGLQQLAHRLEGEVWDGDDARGVVSDDQGKGHPEAMGSDLQSLSERLGGEIGRQNARMEELTAKLERVEADVRELGELARTTDGEALGAAAEKGGTEDPVLDAEQTLERIEQSLNETRSQIEEVDGVLRAFSDRLESFDRQIEECRERMRGRETAIMEANTLLVDLERTYGEQDQREEKRREMQEQVEQMRRRVESLNGRLNALGASSKKGRKDEVDHVLERLAGQLNEAISKRAVAQADLQREGTVDPNRALRERQADLERAQRKHDRVRVQADAIQLLHELANAQRKELAERFTAPLSNRIGEYLGELFEADASVRIQLQPNGKGVSGILLDRGGDGGSFGFDELSGGTREQVSAAVRLAMADLLADDERHAGSLPVVFDDAFTYSDPGRIRRMQRMLGLAARNGLQVVVLTCTPDDYTFLGAQRVTFPIRTDRP